jgi:heat shock protein HslJ
MNQKTYKIMVLTFALSLILAACSGMNLPEVSVPAVDKQARDFGSFSGVTVNFDGGLSFDKISRNLPTGGGNVWPLVKLDLQNDRLIVNLTDGRSVINVGDIRTALNYPSMSVVVKFSGGKGLTSSQDEKTLFVGPNLVDCLGVAPQKCMLVRENPEEPWKYFYDQIEGFQYTEGYVYELKVTEETVENPPADSSSLKLKLVEIVSQTPVTVELTDTTWMLEKLYEQPPLPKSEITAIFNSDGSLYGSAGCNSYTTRYQTGGNTITIQPAATTRMACSETGVMDQETKYLTTLEAVKTFEIVGYRLSLMDTDGEVTLTYMAQQP